MKAIAKSLHVWKTVKIAGVKNTYNTGKKLFVIIKNPDIDLNKCSSLAERCFIESQIGYMVLSRISPNSIGVKDGDKIKLETDSTTGFVIFHGNKKYPNGRCSVHNKAEEGEWVKVKHPALNTYH